MSAASHLERRAAVEALRAALAALDTAGGSAMRNLRLAAVSRRAQDLLDAMDREARE